MASETCEQVLMVLRQILRAISMQSRFLAQSYGITMPQLIVMRALGSKGALSIGALSREVSLSQATVTAIIDRLERKLIVSRQRSSSDRRRVLVDLTERGNQTLLEAPSPIQEAFDIEFSHLEPWEQTQILATLQRVAQMMQAENLPAAPVLVEDPQLPGDPVEPL